MALNEETKKKIIGMMKDRPRKEGPTKAGEFLRSISRDLVNVPARLAATVRNTAMNVPEVFRKSDEPFLPGETIARYSERTNPKLSINSERPLNLGKYLGEFKPLSNKGSAGKQLKDAAGVGLQAASFIPIAEGAGIAKDVIVGGMKSFLKNAAKKAVPLAAEGFTQGLLSGAGNAMQQDKDAAGIFKDAAISALTNAVAAPILGTVTSGLGTVAREGGELYMSMTPAERQAGFVRIPGESAEKEMANTVIENTKEPIKPPEESAVSHKDPVPVSKESDSMFIQSILGKVRPAREAQESIYSSERGKRLGGAMAAGENLFGKDKVIAQLSALKGDLPRVKFEKLKSVVGTEEINRFISIINDSIHASPFEKIRAGKAILKLFNDEDDNLLTRSEIKVLDKIFPKEFTDIVEYSYRPDFFDKAGEYATAVKLFNPVTHITNFGGNAVRQITDFIITTGANINNPKLIKADVQGIKSGLAFGIKNAIEALKNEDYASTLSKVEETMEGQKTAIGGKIGKVVRTPFRMLGAADEIFRTMAFQRKLYREAYRAAFNEGLKGPALENRMQELLASPTKTMAERAINEAKKLTFQEDMGEIVQKINDFRNPAKYSTKGGKLVGLISRLFIPFLKTPVNLLKQSADFSPLGFIKNLDVVKDAIKSGDKEQAAKVIGEATIGTMMMALVGYEALQGNVTGSAPFDPKERDQFYREGKLPYSIKLGKHWVSYKRLEPFATTVGLTADAINAISDKSFKPSQIVGSMVSQFSDKTYLEGISQFMDILTGDDYERNAAIKDVVTGSTIPSISGTIARTIDPKVRDSKTLLDSIKAQVPGLSQTLPAKVDALGNDIERSDQGINYLLNPIQSEDKGSDPVTTELSKIGYSMPLLQRSFTINKVKYDLTPDEYHDFSKYVGSEIKKETTELLRSPSFRKSAPDNKIKKIERIRSDAIDKWKDRYVRLHGKLPNGNRRSIEDIINSNK